MENQISTADFEHIKNNLLNFKATNTEELLEEIKQCMSVLIANKIINDSWLENCFGLNLLWKNYICTSSLNQRLCCDNWND